MSKHRTRATRWNRLLSGVLCLALMLGLMPAAGLIQTVEAAHWADPYGEQLVEWGVMNPSSDLRLGATITRAEFVAMCNRAFGYDKLGGTPFIDVPPTAWYAQDIDIAYNAGYFKGTSAETASPNGTLTREQAAVLIARNLMLQETVGEVQAFTDSHDLSDWSRGLIGAAVAEGMIGGYEDGSYRPQNSITRGEMASMLVRVIGTPINKPGDYSLGDVYGNVVISSSNVTLRNTAILGNLYITGGVDLGNVLLENVTVLGRIVVSGGGESHAGQSSVVLRNVEADELVIDSIIDQFITVSAYGITDIPVTHVRSDAYLEDASWPGYGLRYIELDADPGALLQLAGSIKEVVNKTPFSTLQLAQGTAEKITIDEYATDSELILDYNTRVDELNLDVATLVHGKGDITDLTIGASGCDVEILPEHVTIRPGIEATIAGDVVDSTGAAELSEEPRLLAGYPKVANLRPTQVEGQFAGNKQGTIYYAVSELADGSVSEADLVNNPAYGGIIYENNAGSIAAASKTVYSRDITKLVPDGSYYLTAMLEDGRGNRSPLKVISFTTPDDTVPQFLNGRISRETCDVVQLTGMANKSCQLYWVLLADGAAAPTPQNFKSGSFGGNYGSGTMSVTKNVPVSITVNTQRLQEDTKYVLYVWLNDFNGVHSSQVYRFDVHTPDETPPVVTSIMQTDFGESDAQVTFAINEVPSTLFWAVVTESNATFITPDTDLNSLRAQIKVESGATSIVHGSTPAKGANVDTDILKSVLKGLDYATYKTHSFKMYYVAKDAAGNYSEVGILNIHTLDTDPPHAWLEFSDAVNGTPRANSDIRIVFDEQVKGGASATETFLDIYKRVEEFAKLLETDPNNATYQRNLTTAKNELSKELAAHIQLWYSPRNGSPVQQMPVGDSVSIGPTDSWVIDFHNAVITMENGNLVINLPAGKALNLDSGASYYFQLVGVYDDAFTPNGVAVGSDGITCVPEGGKESDNGNGRLYFTTLYAQVELYENTSVSNLNGNGTTRLDLVVDAVPKSTEKVPDTEVWDLVMWSDTIMTVDIYCKVVNIDDNGKEISTDKDWELVRSGIEFIRSGAGKALRESQPAQITPVQSGLEEGKLYRYGIHITYIGNVKEENPTAEPESWGDLVTMQFSLIAGTSGNVIAVSNQVNSNNDPNNAANRDKNYNDYLRNERISEIGVVYTSKGTESILTCSKQFRDTQAPSFRSDFPSFKAGSGAVTMQISLDRPGKVYYVVAPVNELVPETVAGTSIGTANDGSAFEDIDEDGKITNKENKFTATGIQSLKAATYIPNGGPDREAVKAQNLGDKIWFVGKNRYHTPDYLDIYNGGNIYRRNSNIKTGYVDVETASAIEYVTVPGLKSEQWYYVYFVLEGGGDPSKVVEIYRVKTTKPQVPNVIVTGTATSATIEVTEDCEMSIVLVEYNNLPGTIRGSGSSNDENTPLWQMMYRDENEAKGPSIFDIRGTQKTFVLQYVLGTSGGADTSVAGSWKLPGVGPDGKSYTQVTAGTILTFDFEKYMTSTASEYVVLAVARQINGGTTATDYGYGAARGLFTQDKVPPSFTNGAGNKPGYLTCTITSAKKPGTTTAVPSSEWTKEPMDYVYDGSVTITFTKDIYCSINFIRYTLLGGGKRWDPAVESTAGNTVGILTAMAGSTAKISSATVNGRTVTLTFSGLAPLDTFVFFGKGSVANSSNYPADGALTLTFNPKMYAGETMTSTAASNLLTPGFYVSWG